MKLLSVSGAGVCALFLSARFLQQARRAQRTSAWAGPLHPVQQYHQMKPAYQSPHVVLSLPACRLCCPSRPAEPLHSVPIGRGQATFLTPGRLEPEGQAAMQLSGLHGFAGTFASCLLCWFVRLLLVVPSSRAMWVCRAPPGPGAAMLSAARWTGLPRLFLGEVVCVWAGGVVGRWVGR